MTSNSKKGQGAVEMMILVGAALFFLTIFFISVQINIQEKLKENKDLIVKETAYEIQDEINLAVESGDGYERTFTLPSKISNSEYNVTINGNMIYLYTLDGKNAIAIPVADINGQPIVGENTIRKTNGEVYLNE